MRWIPLLLIPSCNFSSCILSWTVSQHGVPYHSVIGSLSQSRQCHRHQEGCAYPHTFPYRDYDLCCTIPSIGQGLGTKFPLIPNLIAADGGLGQSCSPCLHIDIEWEKGTKRLKSLLLLAASGTMSIRQELRYKPPSPSTAEPPWPGTSADPPLQQTQRETHRRVSCNHLHAQQCHQEPPRRWGSGASPPIWPPSTEPHWPPRPGAAAQARIKAILWHLTLFVTTPAKHHKWILWKTTICVLVSHNTPDS